MVARNTRDSCELVYLTDTDSCSTEALGQIEALEQAAFHEKGSWSAEQLFKVLQEGVSTASVVLVERQIVAFALFRIIPPEGELLRIAVDDRHRRKGYAKLLLQDGIARFGERSIEELFLEVHTENSEAIALYKTIGFTEVGRRPKYYSHHHHSEGDTKDGTPSDHDAIVMGYVL